jgi:hypothetical protein
MITEPQFTLFGLRSEKNRFSAQKKIAQRKKIRESRRRIPAKPPKFSGVETGLRRVQSALESCYGYG